MNSQQSESTSPPQRESVIPSIVETVSVTTTSQVTSPINTLLGQDVTGISPLHGAFRPIPFLPTLTTSTTNYSSYTAPLQLIGQFQQFLLQPLYIT